MTTQEIPLSATAFLVTTIVILAGLVAPAAAQEYMATGTYVGNSTVGHAITEVGFQPDLLIIKGDTGEVGFCATSTMPPGFGRSMGKNDPAQTNRINSLDADGFTLGSDNDTNDTDRTYYWIAMKVESGILDVGNYIGNGMDGHTIEGLAYSPEFMMTLPAAGFLPWLRHKDMPEGASIAIIEQNLSVGGITSFTADGFTLGSDSEVNQTGQSYHYITWNEAPGLVSSGFFMGTGNDDRDITGVGFEPEYVLMKIADTESGLHRPASLVGDSTLEFRNSNNIANGIQALQPDGFQVGTLNAANAAGRVLYWAAFANQITTADLGVGLTIEPASAVEGDTLTLVAVLENLGPDDAAGVTVSVPVPVGSTFLSADPDRGTYDDGMGIWDLGTIGFGNTDTLRIQVSVNAGTAGTQLTGTASISAAGVTDAEPLNDTDSATVDILPYANLTLVHTLDNETPAVGEEVEFVIRISNSGPGDATGVEVEVDRAEGLQFFSYEPSTGSYVPGGGIWTVGDMAAGSLDSLVLLARVEIAFEGATILQSATFTASSLPDPDPSDNTDTVTLHVAAIADLGLALLVDESAPAEGDTVQLTIRAWNAGPNSVSTTLVETTLPDGLGILSVEPSVGFFAVETGIWELGPMASGATDSLILVTRLEAGTAGRTLECLGLIHSAAVSDSDTLNNVASATLTVPGIAPDINVQIVLGEPVTIQPLGLPQPVLGFSITNQGSAPDTFLSLTLTNLTTGEGTPEQLDSVWSYLGIAPNLELVELPKGLPAQVDFVDGRYTISGLRRVVDPDQTIEITILGMASAEAPDGTILKIGIADPTDLVFAVSLPVAPDWPLTSGHVLAVDGFTTDQIGLIPVESKLLAVGSLRNLALIVDLPSNGYLPDTLSRLNVVNHGTALPGSDLARMEAWSDDGDGLFDPISDTLLGAFVHTGDRYELTGLATPIPVDGRRVYFTVDVTETALPAGNALLLGLPSMPDVGVGMLSGNDGPLDGPLNNPSAMGISVSDRIILTTQWIHPGVVYPDAGDLPLIHLIATNTYADERALQRLTVTNNTIGGTGATVAELDATCRQLVLRHDGDGNGLLGDLLTDKPLGSGSFEDGQIDFTGLDFILPPGDGNAEQFFITAELNPAVVADGDRISAVVSSVNDVDITNSTIVAGWPLDSGASWSVDGMIADQLTLNPISVLTLGPGDGPALALDLIVPANGYLTDELKGLNLLNTGSAGTDDLAGMELWEDGGDGVFDAGSGDDLNLGPMIFQGAGWISPALSRPVPLEGLHLFTSLIVSATPRDSSTVRLAVPIGGISTQSGNSGPLDRQVGETGTLVLSTSPLLSAVDFVIDEATVGMGGEVRMTIRNQGGETVLAIHPEIQPAGGTASITLGSPSPASFDLAPGEEGIFSWTFTCETPGEAILESWATGTGQTTSLVRRSVATPTAPLRIYTPVPGIDLYPVTNLPFSINRGQMGVVPITLTLVNPGDENVASGQLTSLRILLKETTDGPDIAPGELLSRILISEGTDIYADMASLPDTPGDFEIILTPPVIITGEEPVTLGVRFDLRADSTLPSFLLAINQADWFSVSDATSGAAVTLSLGTDDFPIQSGMGNLVTQATSMEASVVDRPAGAAGPGQIEVVLSELDLSNLSADGTSSAIELGTVALAFRDSTGRKLANPGLVFSRINLATSFQTHYSGAVLAGPDSVIVLQLSPPVLIPGNTTLTLRLTGDIAPEPPLGPIWPEASNSALFDARDANTGAAIAMTMATSPVASPTFIMGPAESLLLSGQGLLPTHVPQGALNVSAMAITLSHPGTSGTATIAVDTLSVDFFNAGREPIDSAQYLDSIQVMAGETPLGTVLHPLAYGGRLIIPLSGLSLEPGQDVDLDLIFDFRPDAPSNSVEMSLAGEGIVARDLVRGTPVQMSSAAGASLPLYSGSTLIVVAADELVVGGFSLMPAILAYQVESFPVLRFNFSNPAGAESGFIALDQITISQPGGQTTALGAVATEIRATVNGEIWAAETELASTQTEVVLAGPEALLIPTTEDVNVIIEFLVRESLPSGTVSLMVSQDGIVARPANVAGTTIFIRAASGQTFPLASASGTLAAADLASSYANFPNPFEAGREFTTFVYSLTRDARVTLRLLTPHGEPILTLLDGVPRDAGLHQSDQWDGYNERGKAVRSGVYIAELVVDFTDGTRERVLRKVAVVR